MRLRLRPASLRGRVVVGVVALLAVLLGALFLTVDLLLSARLSSDLRTRLVDRVALAAQLDGALSPQQLVNRLRGDGVAVLLCASNSTSRAGSGNALGCVRGDSGPPDLKPPGGASNGSAPTGSAPSGFPPSGFVSNGNASSETGKQPGSRNGKPTPPAKAKASAVQSSGSVLYVRTTLPSTGQELTLSVDSSQVRTTLGRLIALEIIGGLVMLALAVLLLVRLVGTALRPLDRLTGLAGSIAGGDRGKRLGTGRPDTELGRTAIAFDAMLDELESALLGAAAAEARLRAFLSDVSHELRTPLTGLAATTETLLRDEPGRADRERAYVTLVRETRRAGRLVDDLLTVTRLDTGMSLTTARVDLIEIVGHEVDRIRLLAPGLRLEVDGPPEAPVDADAVRLGQIVANLLDNARAASGPDGRVMITVGSADTMWSLDVTDSGPGVPAEDRERIFERLVRLDESRARGVGRSGAGSGGFGLGLPIARALARAHFGDLVCVPSEHGARFRLTLPRGRGSTG